MWVLEVQNGFGEGFALEGDGVGFDPGLFYYRKGSGGFGQGKTGDLVVNVIYLR